MRWLRVLDPASAPPPARAHELTATFTGDPADIQAACFQIVRALNDEYGAEMVGGTFGIHAADGTSLTITPGEPFTVTWRWDVEPGSATGERAGEGEGT